MKDNIGLFLSKRAHLNPAREALVEVEKKRRFTYRELNLRSNRAANSFIDAGIEVGERVAVLAMNSVEFIDIYFALAKIGAIMVPLNWRLVPSELEFILNDSGASMLIYEHEFVSTVLELHRPTSADSSTNSVSELHSIRSWISIGGADERPNFSNDYDTLCAAASEDEVEVRAEGNDNLFIMYTSGTTGSPKGAVHTHTTMIAASTTMNMTGDFRYTDRVLQVMPFFHVGAILPLTCSIHRGSTSILMRKFDALDIFSVIEQERITTGLLVATMLSNMLDSRSWENHDYSSVSWFMCGAAPVPVHLIEKYSKLGIGIHQAYGLTESAGPGCLISPEEALNKKGSTGPALFHTDVRVVRDDGRDAEVGEIGEIVIRGRHVMKEYWNLPEETKNTVRDNWLYTGDMASMDIEGFVYIQDRKKDMIISGGENIYPAEVENVLLSHPNIADVAVVGIHSDKWGESVVAIIVIGEDTNIDECEIKVFCADNLASYKRPKHIEFVDEIPRNPSGKILKRDLRERYSERPAK